MGRLVCRGEQRQQDGRQQRIDAAGDRRGWRSGMKFCLRRPASMPIYSGHCLHTSDGLDRHRTRCRRLASQRALEGRDFGRTDQQALDTAHAELGADRRDLGAHRRKCDPRVIRDVLRGDVVDQPLEHSTLGAGKSVQAGHHLDTELRAGTVPSEHPEHQRLAAGTLCQGDQRDQQTLLAIAQVQQLASPLGGDLLKRTFERLAVRHLANEMLAGLAQRAAGGQLLMGGIVANAHHAASIADDQAQRDLVEQDRPEVCVNWEHPTLICARMERQHGGSHGCVLWTSIIAGSWVARSSPESTTTLSRLAVLDVLWLGETVPNNS